VHDGDCPLATLSWALLACATTAPITVWKLPAGPLRPYVPPAVASPAERPISSSAMPKDPVSPAPTRNDQQLTSLKKLQELHDAVLDFHHHPSKYTQVSYHFVDFHVEKKVVVRPPKGLYLFGGVGTGKTFLMDLFYEVGSGAGCALGGDRGAFTEACAMRQNIPVDRKRRVHFNSFMLDVHDRWVHPAGVGLRWRVSHVGPALGWWAGCTSCGRRGIGGIHWPRSRTTW
jgi:hypothetical protein